MIKKLKHVKVTLIKMFMTGELKSILIIVSITVIYKCKEVQS
jgi:hypothetical protein